MGSTYRLVVTGPVPGAVVERIRARIGEVTTRSTGGGTVLEGPIADQAAVRALLDLLWDAGGAVRLLRVTDGDISGR
ncbi:MAG: hypothetical protein K0S40_2194 [Actinomycetospora sp.]|jgi:hypothetical protein|nr:hypothetical protein [Actinomycetospora sp.]